jgi:predicted P-loop ATPase/GTPase
MPSYNVDAINACMRKAQDYKPKFGDISDTFPQVCTDPSVYGTLPSSAAVSQAVDALNTAMHTQFNAAETKLEQVARALDAVVRSVQNTEDNSVASMTARAQ